MYRALLEFQPDNVGQRDCGDDVPSMPGGVIGGKKRTKTKDNPSAGTNDQSNKQVNVHFVLCAFGDVWITVEINLKLWPSATRQIRSDVKHR